MMDDRTEIEHMNDAEALQLALARLQHTIGLLNDAIGEREYLKEQIRTHRTQRMYQGRVCGFDERLWERAGLPPYIAPNIPGDM